MKARWIESWDGPLQSGERPDPEPGMGEVLIDVEACGVGLTVLNCIRGDLGNDPADLPRIPGHELVGVISGVGSGVDSAVVGQRVMAYFYLSCGRCVPCVAGQESMCRNLGGYLGVQRDGGYAEQVALPLLNAIPLPDGVDPVAATVVPDAIATPVHVSRRANIGAGDRVAVVAAGGGVGIHMVQVAAGRGAAVAGLEANQEKLAKLEELKVDAVDSTDFGAVSMPASWRGEAPDVIVDLLGNQASLSWSLASLAPGGRLVLLTTFRDTSVRLDPREMVIRQQSVIASRYASRSELMFAAELVADGKVKPVVGAQCAPDDVETLHQSLRDGELLGRGVMRHPNP